MGCPRLSLVIVYLALVLVFAGENERKHLVKGSELIVKVISAFLDEYMPDY